MQIFQSETFKKEYKTIVEYIDNVDDDKKKLEIKSLLTELVNCIKKIDTMHYDLVSLGKLSDDASGLRNKIVETRKKIFKIINKN